MNLAAAFAAMRRRLHTAIDARCDAEHRKTQQQGEHARRSMGQLYRWRKAKRMK